MEQALERAAELLGGARAPMVYLAGDLTVEAAKWGIAIADRLRARLDSPASDTVAAGILAQQVRGRAGATLGELINRADTLVFWGVDPAQSYPRFGERYAIDRPGLATPNGRSSRTIIAFDIEKSRGPKDADMRVAISASDEIATLSALRTAVAGRKPSLPALAEAAERLTRAKYAAIIHDAEPSALGPSASRAEALTAWTQALNGPTRAALVALRAGGNRNGIEAVITWQTGFPFGVDFSRGFPRYRPDESAAQLLASGALDALLIAGAPALLPTPVRDALKSVQVVAIGPRASGFSGKVQVAIDTGIAGIHEEGTGYRMDDVPLPLRVALAGPRGARETLSALFSQLQPSGGGR